jgi:iron complex outermembrane recepter protein
VPRFSRYRSGLVATSTRLGACAALLLASTALAGHAHAQHAPVKAARPAGKAKPASASRYHSDFLEHSHVDPGQTEIMVHAGIGSANGVTNTTPGGGLMPKQTAPISISAVTRDYIAKQSPTSNPIALVKALPGVVSASADPLGQTSTYLSIRGLDQTEIGFVYEGAPISDSINYTPFTQNVVDTDNIARVTITQGAPDLTAPVYNEAGGLMSITLRPAQQKTGGTLDVSGGSKSLYRTFLRLDSGELGQSGIRSFVSFSASGNDQWRGVGTQRKYHLDAQAIREWGDGNSAALIVSWDDYFANSFRNPTMAQWKQYGSGFNYTGGYTPGAIYSASLNTYTRDSLFVIAPTVFRLTDELTLHATPTFARFNEYYDSGTTLANNSYFGNQLVNLNLPYTTKGVATVQSINPVPQRTGILSTYLTWEHGHNTFQAGTVYSYLDLDEPIYYGVADFQGGVANRYLDHNILMPDGRKYATLDMNFIQQLNSPFVFDTLKLFGNRLSLSAGLKMVLVSRYSTNLIPGAVYHHGASYDQPLPQVAMSWQLGPHDQIYADGYTTYRAPASVQVYGQLFSSSKPTAVSVVNPLKGEYTIGEELGWRHYGLVNITASFFNYNITNTQVKSYLYVNAIPLPIPLEAGGKTSRGVQAEIGLRPWHHFSPYVSAQYLHATMDNNFNAGADILPTAGKVAVLSPKFTGAIGLSYDDGTFFGNLAANYVSRQYTTFMNDEHIPGYAVGDLTAGYRFHSIGPAKHPQVQLNIANLGGSAYLSGLAGATANAKATQGIYGHTVSGVAPLYIVGGGLAVVGSFTTGF